MQTRSGKWLLFFAAVLWSLVGLFSKQISWNGMTIGIVRGAFAALFTLAAFRRMPRRINKLIVLTGICYLAQGVSYFAANKYTSAANAVVIQNTSPLYIMLVTSFRTKKLPKKAEVLTCLCLFLGIGLTSVGNLSGGGLLGNLLAVASSVFYAGVFLLGQRKDNDAFEAVYVGNLIYLLLFPLAFTDTGFRSASLTDWAFALVLSLLVFLAWCSFARGIKTTPALEANFITMLEIVLAPCWTFLFLHEIPAPLSLVGFVIILVTLVAYNCYQNKPVSEDGSVS